ncbi:MAG TPA: SDR family NAD(P)-dependent oxidoreductase [Candidatus Polarisedimenticolia bacterium]|nr:SDR family NAD(P)-dependent oxidoreductase [Candidatus Polarisedimenticolia bacterium]
MDLGLKGKVAIVTGGSRGIGRATAAALLREGAQVVVSSLRAESVTAATRELGALGRVEGIPADVALEKDVVHLVRETVRRLGRLDVMVANAGIAGTYTHVCDMSLAAWEEMMGIHLRGTFLCAREAAKAMRAAGTPGRIVTVSSTNAYECDPKAAHYNAAKAGILGLTRSLAVDLGPWGIRVNGVAPGWVYTDMSIPDLPKRGVRIDNLGALDRAGDPEEIAAAILFLASSACDFLTGTTLVVDGGQVIIAPKLPPR